MFDLTGIPKDPTIIYMLCAAIVVGGGLMALAMRSAFKTVKETSGEGRATVTQFMSFCDQLSIRTERTQREVAEEHTKSIATICRSNEKAANAIATEVRQVGQKVTDHGNKTTDKLEQIHGDIREFIRVKGQ